MIRGALSDDAVSKLLPADRGLDCGRHTPPYPPF